MSRITRVLSLAAGVGAVTVLCGGGAASAARTSGDVRAPQAAPTSDAARTARAAVGRVHVQFTSWPSARSGWLLGSAPCSGSSCTVLAHTGDAGATWRRIGRPGVLAGAAAIHFADDRDGWAYYPGLQVTHDGGAHWRRLAVPGGTRVTSVNVGGGYAFATVQSCTTGGGTTCPHPAQVWRSRIGRDAWHRLTLPDVGQDLTMAASGSTLYASAESPALVSTLSVSTDAGGSWHRRTSPCDQGESLSAVPMSAGTVAVVCSEHGAGSSSKRFFASNDRGRTFRYRGSAPLGGTIAGVTSPAAGVLELATQGTVSAIYRSADAGRTWVLRQSLEPGSLAGLQAAGRTGAVVVDPAGTGDASGRLLLSHDTGRTWSFTPVRLAGTRTG